MAARTLCLLLLLLLAAGAAAGERFNSKVAALDPFPREVGRGKEVVISGTLKGGYRTPELIVIAPRGKTYKYPRFQVSGTRFTFPVRFGEGRGPYRMEIMVRKSTSRKTAAQFTIWYGRRRPKEEPEPPPPTGAPTPRSLHPRLIEKRFLRRLNAFRKEVGVREVGWNEAVAARAREHAERMARAQRRVHRFGRSGGVLDMLRRDGAGASGLSGPATPWDSVDAVRPFAPPQRELPGRRTVPNHVVVFVLADTSLEAMFERFFVREAAYRLCALDPYCVELAVGAARTPPKQVRDRTTGETTTLAPDSMVYFAVAFVQVNEKAIAQAQDNAYSALFRRAARARDPLHLRALGVWGRPKALPFLARAVKDPRPEVSSAAFDALLLLDEKRARDELDRRATSLAKLFRKERYAAAAAVYAPLRHVEYDAAIPRAYDRNRREANEEARRELARILRQPEADRDDALASLLDRARGLPIEAEIRKQLS